MDDQVIKFERVEVIASRADAIPPEFILSEEDQPVSTTFSGPVPDIPTADLSLADHAAVIRQVSNAAREWGIFQIVNHGIPIQLIQRLQEAGKLFFDLPLEEKELYGKSSAGGIEGYGTQHHDSHQVDINCKKMINKGWNDHLFHRVWPPSRIDHRFWPENPPFYREVNEEYARELRSVADKLFEMLSLGLGLEGQVMKEAFGGDERLEYLMKINYYPPCPRPDATLGVTPHTDLSTLTILVPNEVPGLQVFKDGRWINAKYIPGALIVHIGDQIEILSNGEYKAVFHRTTVEKERVRMSWPVFLEPPGDWVIGPLSQLVQDGQVPKYKSKKFKDYSYCKLNKLPQ